MKKIALSNGSEALVDDDVFYDLSQFRWHFNGYAYRQEGRRTIYMHREIATPGDGLTVDHINRNTLDNRRQNLRCVTHKENLQNLASVSGRSATGFRGVTLTPNASSPFRAQVYSGNRRIFSAYCATIEEAVDAVASARRELLPCSTDDRSDS